MLTSTKHAQAAAKAPAKIQAIISKDDDEGLSFARSAAIESATLGGGVGSTRRMVGVLRTVTPRMAVRADGG
jgi:hypothetical protein